MKTLVLFVLAAGLALAAPITGSIAGTGSTLAAPISAGDTSITFDSNPFASTTLSTMVAAGGSGTMTILPLTISSTNALTVAWAGGLSFAATAPTPVVIGTGPGTFAVFLSGTYSAVGFDATPGMLALTFQAPAVGANYSFSYSGATAPEPATLALSGLALAALGALRWKNS